MATIIEKTTTAEVKAEPETMSDAELVRTHLDLLDSEFETLRKRFRQFSEAVEACSGAAEFGSCLIAELPARRAARAGEGEGRHGLTLQAAT
jgi:hypothetical protein